MSLTYHVTGSWPVQVEEAINIPLCGHYECTGRPSVLVYSPSERAWVPGPEGFCAIRVREEFSRQDHPDSLPPFLLFLWISIGLYLAVEVGPFYMLLLTALPLLVSICLEWAVSCGQLATTEHKNHTSTTQPELSYKTPRNTFLDAIRPRMTPPKPVEDEWGFPVEDEWGFPVEDEWGFSVEEPDIHRPAFYLSTSDESGDESEDESVTSFGEDNYFEWLNDLEEEAAAGQQVSVPEDSHLNINISLEHDYTRPASSVGSWTDDEFVFPRGCRSPNGCSGHYLTPMAEPVDEEWVPARLRRHLRGPPYDFFLSDESSTMRTTDADDIRPDRPRVNEDWDALYVKLGSDIDHPGPSADASGPAVEEEEPEYKTLADLVRASVPDTDLPHCIFRYRWPVGEGRRPIAFTPQVIIPGSLGRTSEPSGSRTDIESARRAR